MLIVAEKTTIDSSSLINITCGASAVSKTIIDSYEKMGISIQQVYGLTEVTGALCFWKSSMGSAKSTSHGKPAYLNEVIVTDIETNELVPTGVRGEIMCKGAVVFAGYWNNNKATRSAFNNEWFATGDIGYFDDDGFLYLVDRLKDIIISGGENIYPAETENIILAYKGVVEVSVVGRADKKWGEVPVAFVVRAPGIFHIDSKDIIDDCRSQIAHYKCPKNVIFVKELPRNSIGKVLKSKLRKMALK